ncbi:MAG: CaiB/BaiF CoA-transferase family protein [Pseudomonadota bacterium]
MTNAGPLSGIRIVDLTRLLPGPFATHYLASLGAEVIKVESGPNGDYARNLNPALYQLLNSQKRVVSLDLRSEEGLEELRALVAESHALLESFRPGVLEAMGLALPALHKINPALVLGSLTGYGQTGPYRNRAGHDLNYLALSGALDQFGRNQERPSLINIQLADQAAGGLTFALGVVSALLKAKTTGQGSHVDVGMADASMALLSVAVAGWNTSGEIPRRGDEALNGGLPNYDVYVCADGRCFALGALEPKFWLAFCQAVERPDLMQLPLGRGEQGAALRAALTDLFRSQPRDYWTERLLTIDACATPVLNLEEAFADPQMRHRGVPRGEPGQRTLACPIKVTALNPDT